MENLSAQLEVFGINRYSDKNYEETVRWLRELADYITENKGKFSDNFTARRFFKKEGRNNFDETYYEMPDGTTRIIKNFPDSFGRYPFPPRGEYFSK